MENLQILAGLSGLIGAQGDRPSLDFALDASKQLVALLLLCRGLGVALALPNVLAEATLGLALQYLLLRNGSPWIFEQLLQDKALRTGEYTDDADDFDPMRYLHQLWIWLLCVLVSQYVLLSFHVPSLFAAVLNVLLAPFDFIDLEGPTMLLLCCLCRALQFRLTDVLVLKRGGLAPQQAVALLMWGACATVQGLLRAMHALSQTMTPSPLTEPLLDVEGAKGSGNGVESAKASVDSPSGGRARAAAQAALEKRSQERKAARKEAPPTTTVPVPAPAPQLPAAAAVAPALQRRDRSPSPRKPKSGGTWTRDEALSTLPRGPSPNATRPRPPRPAAPVNYQVESLKGMIAERDSDLRELHENLDELLKDFSGSGLDAVSPLPPWSPTVETLAESPMDLTSGRSSPSFHSDHGGFAVGPCVAPQPGAVLPGGFKQMAPRGPSVFGHLPQHGAAPPGAAAPGAAAERRPSQGSDVHSTDRESKRLDRRSRRYDVLDRKIDSLLTALGAAPAAPVASPPAPLAPAPAPAPAAVAAAAVAPHFGEGGGQSIDQRIEVLQNKMDHLFRLRDQHAVPK